MSQSSKISNEESKWQYVGNSLWENGDLQSFQESSKSPTVTNPATPVISRGKKASRHFEFGHPFEEFGSGSDVIN